MSRTIEPDIDDLCDLIDESKLNKNGPFEESRSSRIVTSSSSSSPHVSSEVTLNFAIHSASTGTDAIDSASASARAATKLYDMSLSPTHEAMTTPPHLVDPSRVSQRESTTASSTSSHNSGSRSEHFHRITVSEPELKSGKLSQHVTYLITSYPGPFSVRRRYNDFVWLRDTICTLFRCTVPPLPPKKATGRFDTTFIQKRQKELQYFLEQLIQIPHFRTSDPFQRFAYGEESFAAAKKAPAPRTDWKDFLVNYETLFASVYQEVAHVAVPYDVTLYAKKMKEYLEKTKSHYNSIKKATKRIINRTRDAAQDILQCSTAIGNLQDLERFHLMKNSALSEVLSHGTNSYSKWGEEKKKESESMNEVLSDALKREVLEVSSLLESLEFVEDAQSSLDKATEALKVAVDKLETLKRSSKRDKSNKLQDSLPELESALAKRQSVRDFLTRLFIYDLDRKNEIRAAALRNVFTELSTHQSMHTAALSQIWTTFRHGMGSPANL